MESKKSFYVLGINLNTHDSSAALLKDGEVVAAVSEERFTRVKMDGAPPRNAIESVLGLGGITPADIDILAVSDMPAGLRRTYLFWWQQFGRVWYTRGGYLASFLYPRVWSLYRFMAQTGINGVRAGWQSARDTKQIIAVLRAYGFKGKVVLVDHDRAHAAGAFYTSGMPSAFIGIVEGSSFTNACSFWVGDEKGLRKVDETPLPHSPGRYYEVVTHILGFRPRRHEGKITGLAALGDPKVCYKKIEDLLYLKDGQIRVGRALYSLYDEYFARGRKLPKRFEGDTRENIAAAFQKRLEDVIVGKFALLSKQHDLSHTVLSGGVVGNVKLNMEIAKLPEIKELFVHPPMSDAGQPLGAACAAYAEANPEYAPRRLKDVYLGPSFNDQEIEEALKEKGLRYEKVPNIAERAGQLLAQNKIVGLFQGRMEYGPRALGNRSILYPATDKSTNDWLNAQLKRTEFMPFAPVTLAEYAGDCYFNTGKVAHALRFMTMAVMVTPFMAQKMPAAVHVDHTARPQLIDRETNPIYYDAIATYRTLTGLPTVINTSFNMHEEPIVCTPSEGIDAFLQSHLDALAIGNFLVLKPAA
ncbi:MAG: carbamoyltransferase C-terminal domain-containing protein [bacterium]|nr:carbamoyltransferase C-terminal domain-containing protein [bacterium]